jgi:hypothetical protein
MLPAGRPAGAEIARRDHDVTLPFSRAAPARPGGARYAGKHTALGHVAGAAVHEPVSRGARAWLEERTR